MIVAVTTAVLYNVLPVTACLLPTPMQGPSLLLLAQHTVGRPWQMLRQRQCHNCRHEAAADTSMYQRDAHCTCICTNRCNQKPPNPGSTVCLLTSSWALRLLLSAAMTVCQTVRKHAAVSHSLIAASVDFYVPVIAPKLRPTCSSSRCQAAAAATRACASPSAACSSVECPQASSGAVCLHARFQQHAQSSRHCTPTVHCYIT